jgi:small subunit ribosomal protein S1
MSEEISFEQMLDESLKEHEENTIVSGTIVEIQGDNLLLDVGQKLEGRLNKSELDGEEEPKVGDTIEVMIINTNRERPQISRKRVLAKKKFNEFYEQYKDDFEELVIDGKIISKKQSGFIVSDDNMEYFLPASQSLFKRGQNVIGKKVKALVIKLNDEQDTIIISRKKLIEKTQKARKNRIKEILEATEPLEGTIKKITSYGMFIDLDGVDGLVHYNEISYKGPVNPALYYEEGERVNVTVISYDEKKQHLALSIKAVMPNPWDEIKEQLEVGDVIKVMVSNFETYGVFVDLGNDIEGLLHISEITWDKNKKNPKELLNIGDEINVEVIEIDVDKKRLRVSLKNLVPKPFDEFKANHRIGDTVTGKVVTLTDFGAFISVDGIDGLLHNEDLSWDRGDKCKDNLNVGDEIEVKLARIDDDKEKVSFSRKDLLKTPTTLFLENNQLGSIVTGTIKDIKDFGIFVNLADGVDGLIRNEDLYPLTKEEINIGDEIESVLAHADKNKNRIRLSRKRLERQKERDRLNQFNDDKPITLGDMIHKSNFK